MNMSNRRDSNLGYQQTPRYDEVGSGEGVRAAEGHKSQLMALNRDQWRKRIGVMERVVRKDLGIWDLPYWKKFPVSLD